MDREVFAHSFIHQTDTKCLPCARHYADVVGLLGRRGVEGYLSSFLSAQFKPRQMMAEKFR